GIAQFERHAATPAQVAHRGHPRAERLARGANAAQQQQLVIFGQDIAQGKGRATEDQVHVAVDEPGHDRQTRQVDHFGVGRRLTRRLDGYNLPVFDEQRPIPLDCGACPVNQTTRADNLHLARLACPCPNCCPSPSTSAQSTPVSSPIPPLWPRTTIARPTLPRSSRGCAIWPSVSHASRWISVAAPATSPDRWPTWSISWMRWIAR